MASNPYYSEQQRRKLDQARLAQQQAKARTFNVSLDDETKRDLKDISDNTLDNALTSIDIKEGLKSFEDNFKEKFSGFREKFEEENKEKNAEDLPDFVGPRNTIITDDSQKSVQNDVTINQESSLGKIEKFSETIALGVTELLELHKKKKPENAPEPAPVPVPVVDTKNKKVQDDKKKKDRDSKTIIDQLKSIKNNVSGILSKFIGYSVEALASFAKWSLILGSLVFAFDVLSKLVSAWFKDILEGGEKSKNLFGSYFAQIQKLAESINNGLDGFDMSNLSQSLKDLFVEPFNLLGSVIKTAIMDGIGSLIYSLGEYTKSDTIKEAGRGMKVSALTEKQQAGYQVTPEEYLMMREQKVADLKEREGDTFVDTVHKGRILGQMRYGGYNPASEEFGKDVHTSGKATEDSRRLAEEQQKEIDELRKDKARLLAATDADNAKYRKSTPVPVAESTREVPASASSKEELDLVEHYIDSDKTDAATVKQIENMLQALEEKNSAKKLSDSDKERFGDLLELWQSRQATAVPDNTSSRITPPRSPEASQAPKETASTVQVNQKNINNHIQQSVQRTPHKPMISIS